MKLMYSRSILSRINWNISADTNNDFRIEKTDIGKLELLYSYIKPMYSQNNERLISEYQFFWEYVTDKNLYYSALLYKRVKKALINDISLEIAEKVIYSKLEIFEYEESCFWRFLAGLELKYPKYVAEYAKFLLSENQFTKAVLFLQISESIADSLMFLCSILAEANDLIFLRKIFNSINGIKFNLELDRVEARENLHKTADCLIRFRDLPTLLQLFYMCREWKVSDVISKTDDEWIEYLTGIYPTITFVFMCEMLLREERPYSDCIRSVYKMTAWATENEELSLNNYFFFSFAVSLMPDKFETFISLFSGEHSYPDKAYEHWCGMNVKTQRNFAEPLIREPFHALMENSPDKLLSFIRVLGRINPYHSSVTESIETKTLIRDSSETYDQYQRYNGTVNKLVKDTLSCNEEVSENSYNREDILEIYFNSPFKSYVDLPSLIRSMYQPEAGFVMLNDVFDKYTLIGTVDEVVDRKRRYAYQLRVDNIKCGDRFVVYQGWITEHFDESVEALIDNASVYFKIYSVNSHGMVLAYDVKPVIVGGLPEKKIDIRSKAFKMMRRIKTGKYPFTKSASDSRSLILVKIYDEKDRVLIYRFSENRDEGLPAEEIYLGESSYSALRRMLMNYFSYHAELPCYRGAVCRILLNGELMGTVYTYSVSYKAMKERQSRLSGRSDLYWRSFDIFKRNIKDEMTEKIVSGFIEAGEKEIETSHIDLNIGE